MTKKSPSASDVKLKTWVAIGFHPSTLLRLNQASVCDRI